MDLDILFLGRLLPKEYENEIKAKMKSGMVDAANALQWNIIAGMEANCCGKLKILNYLPVGSFPNGYKDLYIKEREFEHSGCVEKDLDVGHCNLSVVKQFTNIIPFKKKVKFWAMHKSNTQKILFIYSAPSLSLELAKYVKSLNQNIQTVCLIADIPEYNTLVELKGIRKVFDEYEIKRCNELYGYIDKFVLLTEQMAEKLNIKVPFIVMEGIAPSENAEVDDSVAKSLVNEKYIFYSGTLNYKFGIGNLLDAFSKMPNPDIKLVICGFGEAEEIIKESRDDRIVYLGKIDRKQVLALQKQATVLVNPRQNNEDFTKYSFPSKTMEYLASGVPVVAYKLDGIPDEYDEYIKYVPDNSPETFAKVLQEMCELPCEERQGLGEKARKFVLVEKNEVVQTKRILDFIENNWF